MKKEQLKPRVFEDFEPLLESNDKPSVLIGIQMISSGANIKSMCNGEVLIFDKKFRRWFFRYWKYDNQNWLDKPGSKILNKLNNRKQKLQSISINKLKTIKKQTK